MDISGMPNTTIHSLPVELLEDIIIRTGSLACCATVCQLWNQIAIPILWGGVTHKMTFSHWGSPKGSILDRAVFPTERRSVYDPFIRSVEVEEELLWEAPSHWSKQRIEEVIKGWDLPNLKKLTLYISGSEFGFAILTEKHSNFIGLLFAKPSIEFLDLRFESVGKRNGIKINLAKCEKLTNLALGCRGPFDTLVRCLDSSQTIRSLVLREKSKHNARENIEALEYFGQRGLDSLTIESGLCMESTTPRLLEVVSQAHILQTLTIGMRGCYLHSLLNETRDLPSELDLSPEELALLPELARLRCADKLFRVGHLRIRGRFAGLFESAHDYNVHGDLLMSDILMALDPDYVKAISFRLQVVTARWNTRKVESDFWITSLGRLPLLERFQLEVSSMKSDGCRYYEPLTDLPLAPMYLEAIAESCSNLREMTWICERGFNISTVLEDDWKKFALAMPNLRKLRIDVDMRNGEEAVTSGLRKMRECSSSLHTVEFVDAGRQPGKFRQTLIVHYDLDLTINARKSGAIPFENEEDTAGDEVFTHPW